MFARTAFENGYQLYGLFHSDTDKIDKDLYHELLNLKSDWKHLAVDAVVFFAAHIPFGRYNKAAIEFNDVNRLLLNCTTLFPWARLVYCSSVAVYGTPSDLPISAQSPFNNPSNYALAKLAGESIVQNQGHGISVRIGAMYGTEMKAGLVNRYCEQAKQQGEIIVYGDGSRLQDYIHISDVANCLLAALESELRTPILCVSGRSISNLDLANLIAAQRADCAVSLTNDDDSPSCVFDSTKTNELLSWRASIPIERGVTELMANNS